jgi:nicotinate-nucleotide pyrophosphorylase (carboxylating)
VWNSSDIQTLVRLALKEDDARQDVTTRLLIPLEVRLEAVLVAKQEGVICGLPLAAVFFKQLAPAVRVKPLMKDGSRVRSGQKFLSLSGSARAILSGERPVLNAIQHLSGIATFTAIQVALLGRSRTRLLDTRKTLPGWRLLEKYAVRCGGGTNHRMSLGDAVLVKENHVRICRLANVDWIKRLQTFRRQHPGFPTQIEIQSWEDVEPVIAIRPQAVLLDNLAIPVLKKMIQTLRKRLPHVEIEISGGVRPEDLPRLAALSPDRISMGRLTHSAPAFDCSLDILRVQSR